MKVCILLRYPKVENSTWKRELIEKMNAAGFEIMLVFGESSYYRHFKVALKEYGTRLFIRKKSLTKNPAKINLLKHFRKTLPVETLNDLNSDYSKKIIREFQPDYLLLLGSGIIRKQILSIPAKGTIHCHHGYLPEFRGVSTAEWSLYHGKDVYLSTHFVDPGIDTGDIILRTKVHLESGDDIDAVRLKCRNQSVPVLLETFEMLRNGTAQPVKQLPEEGKQYFFMHPFFKDLVNRKLKAELQ
jgi:methionyl-tRNA formyltransferase